MKASFGQNKLNGTVIIYNHKKTNIKTNAEIAKGKLKESLREIASRIGIEIAAEEEGNTYLVDKEGLIITSRLTDKGQYYITDDSPAKITASPLHQEICNTRATPDISVLWAFDKRVLLHRSDSHRSQETPYRLERALDMLNDTLEADEMLPQELRSLSQQNHSQSSSPHNISRYVSSRLASNEEILSFQDPEVYSEFLQTGKSLENLPPDVYCNDHTSNVAVKLSVGAVIDTCTLVLQNALKYALTPYPVKNDPLLGFCLVRPPGHHCKSNRPAGFCLVNNVAIAVQQIFGRGPILGKTPRIAILDLDVHFGEGTASFVDVYNRDKGSSFPLLYLSLHRFDNGSFYPSVKEGASDFVGEKHIGCICNIAVDTNIYDAENCHKVMSDFLFDKAMGQVFIPKLESFNPDLIIVSLGFDAAYGDPLGKMAVEGGFALAISMLKLWCMYGPVHSLPSTATAPKPLSRRPKPVGLVTVLEGGYNPESVSKGITSVAYALTYAPWDERVKQCSQLQIPKTWGDLRRKKERQLYEVNQINKEHDDMKELTAVNPKLKEYPTIVDGNDTLLKRHMDWCDFVIGDTKKRHKSAASGHKKDLKKKVKNC